MAQSKCPVCNCKQFYVKNPDDEYDIYEFECSDGEVCFDDDLDDDECPVIKCTQQQVIAGVGW